MNPESKRTGRPKSTEKAEAIRRAAASLFLECGLGGTSMDSIAEAAGVSKQTVYSHYRNKEELFRACIGSKLGSYGLSLEELPLTNDLEADLTLVVTRYLELLYDRDVIAMFRLMISESTRQPEIVRMFWEEGPRRTREIIASYLERRTWRGELKVDDARYAATQLLNLAQGEEHLRLLLGVAAANGQRDGTSPHARRIVRDFLSLHVADG